VTSEVNRDFGSFSAQQLNWKTNAAFEPARSMVEADEAARPQD
jgi:hypothetical protein